MTEQWQELKETITEMRDNGGTGTQQEVCKFLANYMEILEKQMQQPCEDCINREATIEAIYKKYIGGKDAIENAPINDLYAEGLAEAVDAVWDMPSVTPKAEQKWIPCAERLPEDGDTYLVTIEYNGEVIGVDAASYSPVDGYIDKHWETFNDWKEDDDSCYHVTAWMPLPEGYNAKD